MTIKQFFVFLTFFLVAPLFSAHAQNTLPGLQYSCLQTEWCLNSQSCTTNHVHRVRLSTAEGTKATPSSQKSYVTECIEVVDPGTNTPTSICTTGDSTLDKELFCGPGHANPAVCDFYAQLQNKVGYSLSHEATYGTYYQTTGNTLEKQPPRTVSTDALGNMQPSAIEWQSYTPEAHQRRFLIWSPISADPGTLDAPDQGQKQATLSFPTLSELCNGVSWDPEGIAYDAQTGQPINDVSLAIEYSAIKAGPFSKAISGIGEILPPGTLNPMLTALSGFYRFYGEEGYYIITPQSSAYEHMKKGGISISQAVATLYRSNLNYYADSEPIFEKAGVLTTKHIPMILKAGMSRPPFTLQLLSSVISPTQNGDIRIAGNTNGPATIVLEICSNLSGIPNCRPFKEYAPGKGGPVPNNNFEYSILAPQEELNAGESFQISLKPYTISANRTQSSGLINSFITWVASIVPEVSAQEDGTVRFIIEPIPTYLEGYAYDENGAVIPNAIVGVYVSFSPAPIYQMQANEQGYFQITSEYLPNDQYTVKYTKTDSSDIVLSTSQFLAQNNEFMIVESVNPYTYVTASTNPRANVTPQFQPRIAENATTGMVSPSVAPISDVPILEMDNDTQPPSTIVLLIIAIITLLILTAAVALYILKRKNQNNGQR